MIEGEPDEEACHQNYMLMQAHHDFCPHSSLPPAFEAAMHDFEELFEDCHIDRQFDPALAVCTKIADCANSAALLESIDALQASCTEDCSSDECVKAFQMIQIKDRLMMVNGRNVSQFTTRDAVKALGESEW